jgi:hypothetical protein
LFTSQSNAIEGTTVGKNASGQFTINGIPTFLLGISYFDGSTLHTNDLDYLEARGFNYLRVFCEDPSQVVAKDCFNNDGTMKPGKVTTLHDLIKAADDRGMVVQMVCLYGDVLSDSSIRIPTVAGRHTAIANCINEFKTHSNVWFDLVNEHNSNEIPPALPDWATHADMTQYINTAVAACPACIIAYSCGNGFGGQSHIFSNPSSTGVAVNSANTLAELQSGTRVMLIHDERSTGWNLRALARFSNLRAFMNANGFSHVPIVNDEPGREPAENGGLGNAAGYLQLAQDMKTAGAAGFLFHTDAAFDVDSASMVSQLDAVEITAINGLRAALGSGTPIDQVPDPPAAPTGLQVP